MHPLLSLDQLHVISDLHLGGAKPFQIFGSTQELQSLICLLAQTDPQQDVGLLINGDFIDFLAEDPGTYFDPQRAANKLDRIVNDPTFSPVFDALRTFLRAGRRTLIVNLGNHDLELALPWVRARLVQSICGTDPVARSRLLMVCDGSGILCEVGGALALCLHGNEVDKWNVADYEKIRRIALNLNCARPVNTWVPNAGTKMVIDVMNDIKRRYPFVDLLKPEVEAVVPTLLALDPAALARLSAIVAIAGRSAWDAARMATGFLSDAPVDAGDLPNVLEPDGSGDFLVGTLVSSADEWSEATTDYLLEQAERDLARGTKPIDLVGGDIGKQVGTLEAVWGLMTGKSTAQVLREALEKLDADRSFDIDVQDDTFRRLDALVGADIDFVVAGHTHFERALPRASGGRYFNSGTWARLIQIKPQVRQDQEKFSRLIDLFRGGTMDVLDAAPDLVIKRCSIVSIWKEPDGQVWGELRRMQNGQPVAVAASRFPARAVR